MSLRFDCGHIDDAGRLTAAGLMCRLCAVCPPETAGRQPRRGPGERAAAERQAYRAARARFPDWPEEKLRRIARRVARNGG